MLFVLFYADVVELADTPDLGSGARACRFKSCHPHKKASFWVLFLFLSLDKTSEKIDNSDIRVERVSIWIYLHFFRQLH